MNQEHFKEKFGFVGHRLGASTIILPRDYTRRTLLHEYAHTQGDGLRLGYGGILFSALNEAMTERFNRIPLSYPEQRKMLEAVVQGRPNVGRLLRKTYEHLEANANTCMAELINTFGPVLFLSLVRMATTNQGFSEERPAQKSVCLEPKKVLEMIERENGTTAYSLDESLWTRHDDGSISMQKQVLFDGETQPREILSRFVYDRGVFGYEMDIASSKKGDAFVFRPVDVVFLPSEEVERILQEYEK
ncbi:MAG TPA: hypothetical protein VJB99_03260 [Patescibacteria group bacterium]|nr:hypothetical protein [Patescibacteria group bacterium]